MWKVVLDFIKTDYFVVSYGITWFISVITYKKYFDTVLKYLPIIIAYTFFSELLGGLVRYNEDIRILFGYEYKNHNNVIYNVYHICFFSFFFYIYWKTISNQKQKKIVKYGGYLFILMNLINIIFQNPIVQSLVYAYLYGVAFLIYCTIIYFKQIFKVYTFDLLKYNLLFWVSLGLLVFHTIYFPLKILKEFFPYDYYLEFRGVHFIIIVVMYFLFSIGFIISKRKAFR